MRDTAEDLQAMADFISCYGLHTGDQFATTGPHGFTQLDICAVAYRVTEHTIPEAFFTDEGTARDLIEASEPAMAAIRAISAAITNYEVPDTGGRPDVIDHVSQWTFTNPIGEKTPPSTSEAIGCILRAANHATTQTPAA